MRSAAVWLLLAAAAFSGCFGDDAAPVQEDPVLEAGDFMMETQSFFADGGFRTSYDAGAGPLPGTVPAPVPVGTYTFDASVTGLPDLPPGLAYTGFLVAHAPVTGAVSDVLAMAPFEGDSLGMSLLWSAQGNHQDHDTVLVAIGTANATEPGIPVAHGLLEGLETGGGFSIVNPFAEAHGHAYAGEDGILHFDATGLPDTSAVSYGAWAMDLNGTWHLLGIAEGQEAFHLMSDTALPPLGEIRLTLEAPGAPSETPSRFVIAKAELVAMGDHAGH